MCYPCSHSVHHQRLLWSLIAPLRLCWLQDGRQWCYRLQTKINDLTLKNNELSFRWHMLAIKAILFFSLLSVCLVVFMWGQIVSDVVVRVEFLWEHGDRSVAVAKSEGIFLLKLHKNNFIFLQCFSQVTIFTPWHAVVTIFTESCLGLGVSHNKLRDRADKMLCKKPSSWALL